MPKSKQTKKKRGDEGTSLVPMEDPKEEEYVPDPEDEGMEEGEGDDHGSEGDEKNAEDSANEDEISEFDRWVQAMPKPKFICEREFDIQALPHMQ